MSKATIADRKPLILELNEGTSYCCSCGKSKNQPFCDGSHAGSEFQPKEITIERKRKYAMCLCKHTQNPPFCDGGHSKLPAK